MKVKEFAEYLLSLKDKQDYTVLDDGYLNEILKENIRIDDKNKEIYL